MLQQFTTHAAWLHDDQSLLTLESMDIWGVVKPAQWLPINKYEKLLF
jgi:hypothetical protein